MEAGSSGVGGGGGGGGGGGRRRLGSRETSPDRARAGSTQQQQHRLVRTMKKVQVVYYLSRNGQLEHPHFMELPQLPNQHLRLKDVMDRLTVLRGRGMPSLFSWSCKRSYKNGYVWNDLAENDIIYPADGAEYVLKGSEIIQACSERFQHVKIANRQPKPLQISHNRQQIEVEEEEGVEEEEEVEQEAIEEDVVDKFGKLTVAGSFTTRCSRGISTDEIERVEKPIKTRDQPIELSLDDASPPSSSSSDKATAAHRFEDGDPAGEPGQTRNSVLLQLIACGSVSVKGRAAGGGSGGSGGGGLLKAAVASAAAAAAGASSLAGGRRGGASNKGLVSRFASRAVEEDELRCVSDNPRFRHPPLEEKEYFSGSIVEGSRAPPGPSLKKSNSYNEERSSTLGIGERRLEAEEETAGVKGKCIPGRKKPSGKQQQQQQPKKGSQ